MFEQFIDQLLATSLLEFIAVILAVAYVILASRENNWCWAAALVSSGIFLYLLAEASLYAEAVLQIYYIGMAVYGWWSWKGKDQRDSKQELAVSSWSFSKQLPALGIGVVLTLIFGLVGTGIGGAMPFMDAFTTAFSLVATWMVTRKILENWLYWIVIDAVSVYLYFSRDLAFSSLLFVLYVVLAVAGYLAWKRAYQKGTTA